MQAWVSCNGESKPKSNAFCLKKSQYLELGPYCDNAEEIVSVEIVYKLKAFVFAEKNPLFWGYGNYSGAWGPTTDSDCDFDSAA